MGKNEINLAGKDCRIYGEKNARFLLIQFVDDHDLSVMDQETEEIAARRRACTGTREAADAINAGLRAAGFEGFVLRARPEEELYELVRPDGLPAESLSEG